MEEKFYNVTNRSGGFVVYTVAEMNNLTREYNVGETKRISEQELNLVNNMPGGRVLLSHFLMVTDPDALEKIGLQPEPEYFLDIDQVKDLLINGSLDQLLDALDFAPAGVVDIIKDQAVMIPCNDVAKRQAILDKTGFDVDKAIENRKLTNADKEEAEAPKRRVAPIMPANTERRSDPPKFNIGVPAGK